MSSNFILSFLNDISIDKEILMLYNYTSQYNYIWYNTNWYNNEVKV